MQALRNFGKLSLGLKAIVGLAALVMSCCTCFGGMVALSATDQLINGTYTPGPGTLQAQSLSTEAVRMATLDIGDLTVFPTDTVAPPATETPAPTDTSEPTRTLAPSETAAPTDTAVPPTPIPPTEVPPTIAPPPTAVAQPTAVPPVAGPPNYDHDGNGRVNCSDFTTQAEAQEAYNAGYTKLDGNPKNGIACESLP